MFNAQCHTSSGGALLNYRQRCEQKALLTTSVMVAVNQWSSVLLLDAQTFLNRCCSITLEHRLIFQAGPIADTWHLLTWKPLDCDWGSMASLHPSRSPWFYAALTPVLLFHKMSLFSLLCPPFFLLNSDTDRSIDLSVMRLSGQDDRGQRHFLSSFKHMQPHCSYTPHIKC